MEEEEEEERRRKKEKRMQFRKMVKKETSWFERLKNRFGMDPDGAKRGNSSRACCVEFPVIPGRWGIKARLNGSDNHGMTVLLSN